MKAIIAISDTHIGSYSGLCPSEGIHLEDGGTYKPSKFQLRMWGWWEDFWGNWVPKVTQGAEKVGVVVNGDLVDGNHHNATNLLPNIQSQEAAAEIVFRPIVGSFADFAIVKGTEAHGGIGEQSTERIARNLKAIQDPETEQYSWWQLWREVEGLIFQFAHHIGTTSSAAYETSAPMRELVAGLVESSQWGQVLPDVFVRSHRHRYIPISIPSEKGDIQLVVTPGWQLRTPYIEKMDRMRLPHIGGVAFLVEDGECRIRKKMYPLPKPIPIPL